MRIQLISSFLIRAGLCLALLGAGLGNRALGAPLPIIPQPVRARAGGAPFVLTGRTALHTGPGLAPGTAARFREYVRTVGHLALRPGAAGGPGAPAAAGIFLRLDARAVPQAEGYRLVVGPRGITLTGHDAAGVFYGLQTLSQLMPAGTGGPLRLPGCVVEDYPRFGYRGVHLDVSRHLFPVPVLKKWLDVLAFYKINTLHWHLTDDQGWRIEIKKYPRLQSVAAYRAETLIGHKKELPHRFDGQRYGGYYTQAEAREVVRYAAARHITVIPEIEMPGHALAALAAYPALGCTGGPYQTATFWGVFDDVYCAGNEATFSFLEGVMDEVAAIFPSRYLHIGGDECPKVRWQACPKCQQRMKDEHLPNEQALQSYFIRRISQHLATKNRRVIGWDEIMEGGLTPGATVMSWTGEQGGVEAAKLGHPVIMTPEKYVYLDYYQSLNPAEPLAAGGYTPLSKTYGYEPVPTGLSAAQAGYVRGVQANLWSEYLPTAGQAEYMLFPRVLALAEIAWSPRAARNLPAFLARTRRHEWRLRALGVATNRAYDQITDTLREGPRGLPLLELRTSAPGAEIHFTTDGQEPTVQSPRYLGPLPIARSGVVRAGQFGGGGPTQPLYSREFDINLATGKPVALAHPPAGNFAPPSPGRVLTNGVAGSARYNDGQWVGFSGLDLGATLDLGAPQRITVLGTNILCYFWQKMWAPTELVFSVSVDGVSYQDVYRQTDFPVNGINPVRATIAPVQARYVRVRGLNRGPIPAGAYGAGGKAWLLIDELLVN
ncbi:glycoside hydrolase family 20 protein [Hymenobacter coccineus]|uniref:glycoside hydrolase family 20 protein n=1 Tax=Hymenobacter coccineus TaxID=1908235 RepID=UPI000ABCBCA2|nr:family 20 glycosylhydrolase [Hymenobacter coccineus]